MDRGFGMEPLKIEPLGKETHPVRRYVLMVISLLWFAWALSVAIRGSSFGTGVGWAVPFTLLMISLYLVLSGAGGGPLRSVRAVRALAVCGSIILGGGVCVWVTFVTLNGVSPQNTSE